MRANLPTKIAVVTFITMWLIDMYVYEVPSVIYTVVSIIAGVLLLNNVIADKSYRK